jgi:hypothetical protein
MIEGELVQDPNDPTKFSVTLPSTPAPEGEHADVELRRVAAAILDLPPKFKAELDTWVKAGDQPQLFLSLHNGGRQVRVVALRMSPDMAAQFRLASGG